MSTIADAVIDSHVHTGDRERSTYFSVDAVTPAVRNPPDAERAALVGATALATYDSRRNALQSKES